MTISYRDWLIETTCEKLCQEYEGKELDEMIEVTREAIEIHCVIMGNVATAKKELGDLQLSDGEWYLTIAAMMHTLGKHCLNCQKKEGAEKESCVTEQICFVAAAFLGWLENRYDKTYFREELEDGDQ